MAGGIGLDLYSISPPSRATHPGKPSRRRSCLHSKNSLSFIRKYPSTKPFHFLLRHWRNKYDTETVWNLEICGAAFRPLPMFLNRPLIKILEDLGIPNSVFQDLQDAAIDKLRRMTDSPINTASLLREVQNPKATKLPTLIQHLGQLGLDYQQDDFLWKVVQMMVVSQLGAVKYKGRISVDEGVTLYGTMDETNHLKEGEIFVITEKAPEGGKRVLVQNNVVITRSPAMHPGHIQVVNAVDVPANSPLQKLPNVVVFSQQGKRDLPSQLSGGDLDGDLYNIMWSSRMVPRTPSLAADYPRVQAQELDREVNLKDMIGFFVDFCESGESMLITFVVARCGNADLLRRSTGEHFQHALDACGSA